MGRLVLAWDIGLSETVLVVELKKKICESDLLKSDDDVNDVKDNNNNKIKLYQGWENSLLLLKYLNKNSCVKKTTTTTLQISTYQLLDLYFKSDMFLFFVLCPL